jgi:hypothetical protein
LTQICDPVVILHSELKKKKNEIQILKFENSQTKKARKLPATNEKKKKKNTL